MNHSGHKRLDTNICVYGRASKAGSTALKAAIMNSHRPAEKKITALNNPGDIQNLSEFFNSTGKKINTPIKPVVNPYAAKPFAQYFNPPPQFQNINPYHYPMMPITPMYNPYLTPKPFNPIHAQTRGFIPSSISAPVPPTATTTNNYNGNVTINNYNTAPKPVPVYNPYKKETFVRNWGSTRAPSPPCQSTASSLSSG